MKTVELTFPNPIESHKFALMVRGKIGKYRGKIYRHHETELLDDQAGHSIIQVKLVELSEKESLPIPPEQRADFDAMFSGNPTAKHQ